MKKRILLLCLALVLVLGLIPGAARAAEALVVKEYIRKGFLREEK